MVALMCDCCCKDEYTIISDFSFRYNLVTPVFLDIPRYDGSHPGHYDLFVNFGHLDNEGRFVRSSEYGLYFHSFLNGFYQRDYIFFKRFLETNHISFDGKTQFFPYYPDLSKSSIIFWFSHLLPEHLLAVYNHLCSYLPQINVLLDDYVNFLRGLPKYPDMPTDYPIQFFNLIKSRFLDNPRVIYNFSVNVRVCVRCDKRGNFKSFEILSFEIKDL
jgi:hypothetical protein